MSSQYVPTRLEQLMEKLRKPPCKLTTEEALELQQLAREDRQNVGQRAARAQRGKSKQSLTLEEAQKLLEQL